MQSHPSLTGKGSRSTCSCQGHRVFPSPAAAAAAAPRHRSCSTLVAAAAQSQQQPFQYKQQQQHIPVLPVPGQALQQHKLWPSQRLQHKVQQSRCSVIPAAGRRRRQDVGAPAEDEDPDLDMDDVMFAGDGDEEDADVVEADVEEEFEEFEEDEEDEDEYEYDEGAEGEDLEDAAQGDDWAAALDDFDTSLDAQAAEEASGPTKEEQELAAAKALVDYDDYDASEDGTSLIISEVPPEEPERPKTFDEKTVALSPQDKQTLEQNMASYTVFPMHELELLVSSTPDGQLVLADCFCLDTLEDSFLRPRVGEGIPNTPAQYQIIPWEFTKTGDILRNKEPEVQRWKLYFIGLHSSAPHEVDMSRIYSFDAQRQQMEAHTPRVLGAERQEDMVDPVMRIRDDGVWIEDAADLQGTYFIAEGFAGHPLDRYENPDKEFDMHEFVKMGLWDKPRSMEDLLAEQQAGGIGSGSSAGTKALIGAGPGAGAAAAAAAAEEAGGAMDTVTESALEERLEELELMEELDDMPDVPAVDMM